MDVKSATSLAEQFLSKSGDTLNLGDKRLDVTALALIDTNQDYRGDKQELVDAFVAGRIKVDGGKIVPANTLSGLSLSPRTPDQQGLQPTPWFQTPAYAGGDPQHPPTAVDVTSRFNTPGADAVASSFGSGEIRALAGKDFATVAGKVTTPADVAFYLNNNIEYDNTRNDHDHEYGSWSSDQVLKGGMGVCRDQHALARDLLVANGYNAVLLGYSAADQPHAITAYQDKTTGKWGILEYGTLYPPSKVNADTAEEALLIVRPATLAITRFSNDGPGKPSHVDGIIYTRASRVYEQFMQGPSPDAGTGATVTDTGISATVASNDRKWQAGMKVVTDPRLPYLQGAVMVGVWHNFENAGVRVGVGGGYVPNNTENLIGSNEGLKKDMGFAFVSAEEFHPQVVHAENIGGSGINLKVGSHTTAQALVGSGTDEMGKRDVDFAGTSMGISSLKWNPTVTVDRDFKVWNKDRADTKLSVGYGMGVDAGLLAAHYMTGGTSFPVNQYLTAGVTTKPTTWLSVSATGYVPLQNVSNDFHGKPLARIDVATPYLRVGTTQGSDLSRYDVSSGINVGKHVNLAAFASYVDDRQMKEHYTMVGARLTVATF